MFVDEPLNEPNSRQSKIHDDFIIMGASANERRGSGCEQSQSKMADPRGKGVNETVFLQDYSSDDCDRSFIEHLTHSEAYVGDKKVRTAVMPDICPVTPELNQASSFLSPIPVSTYSLCSPTVGREPKKPIREISTDLKTRLNHLLVLLQDDSNDETSSNLEYSRTSKHSSSFIGDNMHTIAEHSASRTALKSKAVAANPDKRRRKVQIYPSSRISMASDRESILNTKRYLACNTKGTAAKNSSNYGLGE
ncbi:hypothetical protein KAFR_0H00260 [Kazachstania africana CBS 2517]|uniref:Uncharacterized protein n=1 Tax=Kazachstania africana (strain ATCC 22294 / BCRC 22015 / CBS 2517 / CECT 1963 / NBRC 1671 / NRRL Y-8276) TaxID=1071382 RepID=H2AYM9_KAZAF|nr:hypothetical protein KAFR_0H00260 [Kazachstania africana CBS 2517]CCF59435.1 hypothetical protein KAFR_0H00260 [Kazachstania africana CBS 2517]